jgi:hypothetical protein
VTGIKGTAVAFGDLDGDGDLDVLVGDFDGHARLRFYRNDGTKSAPNFVSASLPSGLPATDGSSSGRVQIPAIGDFDHDGLLDVGFAVGDFGTLTTLKYYRNLGNGSFSQVTGASLGLPSSTPEKFGAIRFKDVDFDGDSDAFIISGEYGHIAYYRNNGSGNFSLVAAPFSGVPEGLSYPLLDLADIDGDGDYDLFVGVWNTPGAPFQYFRNSAGTFASVNPSTAFPSSDFTFSPGKWLMPSFVDIDGDGDLDMFLGDYDSSSSNVPIHFRLNNAPSVTSLSPTDNSTGLSLSQTFTITFTANVAAGVGNVIVKKTADNSTIATMAASSLNFNANQASFTIPGLVAGTSYYITWSATAFKRSSDNASITGVAATDYWNFATGAGDTTPPNVTSVNVPSANLYPAGANLNFIVNFDEPIIVSTVGGAPRLPITLDTGGTVYAGYVSGTGSSALLFRYTIAGGNVDADGISLGGGIDLHSGTLNDAVGNPANLALQNVDDTTGVHVDGVAPTIVSINRKTPAGQFTAATAVTFHVLFSKPVQNVSSSAFTVTALPGSSISGVVTGVSGSGTDYDVEVQINSGSGAFRLDVQNP